MLILALDTSTDHSSVALCADDVELAAWREVTHQDLLRRLAPEVAGVLARARRDCHDLQLVAAGLGPGSFTSLRVGLATAKGICLAQDIPLVGIPTLAAMTWQARASLTGLACPVLDARRGEVYAGFFRATAEGVARVAEEFVATGAALAERISAAGEPVTLLGEIDLPPVREAVAAVPSSELSTLGRPSFPDAAPVAYLGRRLFAEQGAHDLDSLKPIYVRKSYAEEKLDIDLGLR